MADGGSGGGVESAGNSQMWFAKPGQEVLFYRINRRPIGGDPSLFHPDPDLLGHLERVLEPAEPATSGTQYKRTWRLGDLRFNRERGTFTGRLGWARSGEAVNQSWDEEQHSWMDRLVARDESAVSPVAFSSDGRILGVLKNPSFSTESVLGDVLSQILNLGERQTEFATTEWSVEPLGDSQEFYEWLQDLDQLLTLRMVFERPNPDGEEQFQELFERLDAYEADQIKEEIRARDETTGLKKEAVQEDPTTQGFMVAALRYAFGRVWAKGKRRGRTVHYDQRKQVARTSIDIVGSDWETATSSVLDAVERQTERRQLTNGRSS
ncbi:hypothetical protein RZO50_11190 [Microbacterium sp. SSW1-59]|uniref:hypothetical protein n=1 Tax=Microbacterium xanthum TaxID=3079794 RepID=UPI002AD24AAB|nr:hypothetical protein [Microbacterium sp. SSW1-59]MDZ8202081.1 hypothetical protein [Microbacterium sp. SSW1-59]